MNFNLSDEQRMLQDAAARFVREQYAFELRRDLLAKGLGWSAEHWHQYAEMGWLGLLVDEDFGGLGWSFAEMTVLMEQLGACMNFDPVIPVAVIAPLLLQRAGHPALCERWLPALASGDAIIALAHQEVAVSGRGALPELTATREGDGYRLDGNKLLVLGGSIAHGLLVSARVRSGDADTLGIFLLDPGTPGVARNSYVLVDGRGCADLALVDVRCDAGALILSGPAAVDALDEALDRARVAALAEAVGGMESCMKITAEYLKSRVQFGQPLAKFQALQHTMADMFVDVQDARSTLYRALAHLNAPAGERRQAVASAQLLVGDAGRRAAAAGLQLHGGYGMTDEYPVSHFFRQQLVLEKLWGDAHDALQRMAPA